MTRLLCTACAAAMSLAATASIFPAHAMTGPDTFGQGLADVRFDHGNHGGGRWHGGWGRSYDRHGWWVPPAAGFLSGVIVGNAIASPPAYYRAAAAGNAHIRWCYEHRPNYNPYNNTFSDSYGYRHVCYAPV